MSLKRTTIVFVTAAALAAWFAGATTPGRAPIAPVAIAPAPVDATGAELASEIGRLRERLRPESTPRAPTRNPFAFRSSSSENRAAGAITRDRLPPNVAAADPAASRLQLTLAGVAEDVGPEGVVRTAIISGNGQLFLARPGDTVTDRGASFRVDIVFPASVELTSLADGTTHRLALK